MENKQNTPQNYESAVKELNEIVSKIEVADIPLERMMELYERGKYLLEYCEKQLDKFEEKIEVINRKKQEN